MAHAYKLLGKESGIGFASPFRLGNPVEIWKKIEGQHHEGQQDRESLRPNLPQRISKRTSKNPRIFSPRRGTQRDFANPVPDYSHRIVRFAGATPAMCRRDRGSLAVVHDVCRARRIGGAAVASAAGPRDLRSQPEQWRRRWGRKWNHRLTEIRSRSGKPSLRKRGLEGVCKPLWSRGSLKRQVSSLNVVKEFQRFLG